MWCEPGAMFLRCVHCGKRSSGWAVEAEVSRRTAPRAAVGGAASRGRSARAVPAAAASHHRSTRRRQLARRLTVRGRRDHNNSRAGSPHHQRRAQSSASIAARRLVVVDARLEISLRTQHRASCRARSGIGATARPAAARAIARSSSTTRIRTSSRARTSRRELHPPGLQGGGAQGRHRRLARGESADRNERRAEAGDARARAH